MMPHFPDTCCELTDRGSSGTRRWGARLRRVLVQIAIWPIGVYRTVLSPLKRAPSCRYLPTCSEYAEVAIVERGLVKGSILAVWRLLRCNPLFRGGYDPVPPSGEKVHAGPR